jgi:hypothetical protein
MDPYQLLETYAAGLAASFILACIGLIIGVRIEESVHGVGTKRKGLRWSSVDERRYRGTADSEHYLS